MWDCPGADVDGNGGDCSVMFDPQRHTLLLNDVGATAIYVLDCLSLAELATIINRPQAAAELVTRAMTVNLAFGSALWDDEFSAFSNLLTNGSFYRRTSPTTFYPLMVIPHGDGSNNRARRLITSWLTNSSRFCIDVNGNWPERSGNNDECWWGLPSISFDDPSFYHPASYIYWRGTIYFCNQLQNDEPVFRLCLGTDCSICLLGSAPI